MAPTNTNESQPDEVVWVNPRIPVEVGTEILCYSVQRRMHEQELQSLRAVDMREQIRG